MNHRRLVFACLNLLFAFAGTSGFTQPVVPDALEPWRDWVLVGQEHRACPVLNGRGAGQQANFICAWPGELEIAVDLDGASFEQPWSLYKEEWVPLPGDERYWPETVLVDGEPQAAVLRNGRPTVRVPAGEHRIGGRLVWQTRPASVPVPPQTGLVALELDGAAITLPELERGVLWLGLRPELVVDEDRLNVEVYRLLSDEIPIRLTTRIELDVAGQSREIELTGALAPDFVGESLNSGLPAELAADGTLRVQVRPGRWNITLIAHHPELVTELERPAAAPPWPDQEIWSFRSNPALRISILEGAPAVDSQRAGVPAEWRNLPSFAVAAGDTLDLIERSRNDATADNELSLVRFLWLDFDGTGFTAEDRVSGELRSRWRLDMAPPYTMTMAALGNENLLVTEGLEAGTQGVELRARNLQLNATARLPMLSSLPVTGYTDSFDAAATVLHLPPAHRLIAAPGADSVEGAWIERWRLLDIFLALIVAVAAWRLLGRTTGLVALATMVLIFHEPGAPQYGWLNLLIITALLGVLPEGRLRAWGRRYRYASLAVLALLLVPFVATQLKLALFPQLEQPALQRAVRPAFDLGASIANLRGLNVAAGTRALTLTDSRRLREANPQAAQQGQETVVVTGTRIRRDDYTAPNATTVVTPEDMRALGVISVGDMINQLPTALVGRIDAGDAAATYGADAMSNDSQFSMGVSVENTRTQIGRYQPGALVQTGPGLPDWAWTSYALGFDGPIDREQTVSLVIFGPWLMGLWRVASVALALVFVWLLAKPDLPFPRGRIGTPSDNPSSRAKAAVSTLAATVLAASVIAVSTWPQAAAAQTVDGFPSPQLLDELKNRLTESAPCQPSCAELTRALVTIEDSMLVIELEIALQDTVAVPIPGTARGWRASRISVDGTEQSRLFRADDGQAWIRLETGVRDLRLEGPIPETDSLTLAFPLSPRRIAVAAPGWDVTGIADGRLPSGALELIRQRQADGDTDAIQPTAFPPYVRVTRNVQYGLDWTVTTTVQRITPATGAFTLGIDLLPGESVVTPGVEVEAGVASAVFAVGQGSVLWQSRIETGTALTLTAGNDVPWTELWRFIVGHEWHAEYDGPPAIQHSSAGNSLVTDFLPRPGETLNVALTRPTAVSGDTIAIDDVYYTRNAGERSSASSARFVYRSTRADEHRIALPDGSELQSVMIDGQLVPLEQDGNRLTLPVTPGRHNVVVNWRDTNGIGLRSAVPALDLGAGASNLTLALGLPGDRWTLFTYGPTLGPAVLYWAELAVFALAAFLLGRVRLSPLRTHEWLLLGLGLSTFSWPVLLLFTAWAFLLSVRGSRTIEGSHSLFNAAQIALALLTLTTIVVLIVSVGNGLLGSPDMHIVSPLADGSLSWFIDRTDGTTPSAGVISVSLWFYKAAMLAWALWLSFAVLRWLRFGWSAWSFGGIWRGKSEAAAAGSA